MKGPSTNRRESQETNKSLSALVKEVIFIVKVTRILVREGSKLRIIPKREGFFERSVFEMIISGSD